MSVCLWDMPPQKLMLARLCTPRAPPRLGRGSDSADVVFECTGVPAALLQALDTTSGFCLHTTA